MSIPGAASPLFIGAAAEAAAFQIDRSLRFNDGDSAYLNRTPSSAGNRKTWTWSGWVKRSGEAAYQQIFSARSSNTEHTSLLFWNDDAFVVRVETGGTIYDLKTSQVFRDFSAWYHFLVAVDTTQATAANRVKIYINGSVVSAFSTASYPPQNTETYINSTSAHDIGRFGAPSNYFDGYLTEIQFVDGQALAASDFGEYDSNNVWQPKEYSGTYGTNGFHLDFSDNSSNAALGTDSSGNNNTWTVNNIAAQASTYAVAGTHSSKDGISFNGTNAEITLTSNSDVNPGSGVFTLECYAYALSGGSAEFGIYDGSPGGNGSFVLRRVGSGTLMVERHNTAFDITGAAFSENTWHHVAVTRDSSNNVRLFVDGTQSGSTSTGNTHNYQGTFRLGRTNNAFTNGYISNLRLIKGTCLYTSNFTAPTGNLTNVTNTKLLMAQSTTSATAATVKPSGVTISGPGDSTVIDSLIDTPTNGTQSDTGAGGEVSGNYATFNPLMATSEFTYADGNLETSFDAGDNNITVSTIAPKSGKWYAEIVFTASGVADNFYGEVAVADASKIGQGFNSSTSTRYREGSADIYGAGTATGTKSDFAVNDVMGVAVDADNDTVYFYKNNTLEGTVTGLNFDGYAIGVAGNSGTNRTFTAVANYGQRPFAYSAPSGYKALCTTNLDDPTIADGSTAFEARTYTGVSGASSQTGYNFSPDFLWIKRRNSTNSHNVFDTVRGAGQSLFPNLTNAESDDSAYMTAFTSDGYSFGTDGGNTDAAGGSYVAWAWDAGSSTVSNTDGSITSSVRVNQTAGFSIVSWTGNNTAGATVGHGLSAKPDWIVIKNRNDSTDWQVYHSAYGATKETRLNTTGAAEPTDNFNDTEPTSSVFSLGASNLTNGSSDDMIAYCWSGVSQYSAFGSYEGNQNADGPFVFTGFRPRYVLLKQIDNYGTGYEWFIFDTARDTFNVAENTLKADLNAAEYDSDSIDILSNGFKVRASTIGFNLNLHTFIYCAFGEHPFKTARAR